MVIKENPTVLHIDRIRNRVATGGMLEVLLKSMDFESILAKLNIKAKPCGKNEYVGYCPDHFLRTGRYPSDPKWYANSETGLCYCMTESKGSSILKVAQNILGLNSEREAFEVLMNGKETTIFFNPQSWQAPEPKVVDNTAKLKEALEVVEPILDAGYLSENCLKYFAKDGITEDTLRRFGVAECRYGKYRDRAIVPFLDHKLNLVGFVAIDLLGKEKWAEYKTHNHLLIDTSKPQAEVYAYYLKRYKKTLYAPGFMGRNHLYGLFENLDLVASHPESLVIVEGERDALKLMQEGIPCISVHGTAIKEEQVTLLKSTWILPKLKALFLGFDMDRAGFEAVKKAFDIFSREIDWDRIYVLNFPDGKDPKKFTRNEILSFMEDSRKVGRRSRAGVDPKEKN